MSFPLTVLARLLRFFPGLLLAFVIVSFGFALNEFFTQTANQLSTINASVGGR